MIPDKSQRETLGDELQRQELKKQIDAQKEKKVTKTQRAVTIGGKILKKLDEF